jgi:hypothetical protein
LIILSQDNPIRLLTIDVRVCIVINLCLWIPNVAKVFVHVFMVANTMLCSFLENDSLNKAVSSISLKLL